MAIDLKAACGRRQFLGLLGAGALWGLLPGCRQQQSGPLKVAAHVWPGYEFMFMAQREGDLDARQVMLRETASASESMLALKEGTVDAAALTLDEVLRARASGTPLSVVLVFDISAGADVLLGRPGMRQLSDIKGKRIGVEQGALGALMLAEALQVAGLKREEVQVVPLTIDQHDKAWQRGEIDVLVCFPPTSSKLMDAGAVNLFDSRRLPDTIVDVLAVRQDILEEKGDAIRHLVRTHMRALRHLQTNPQDASYRMAAHLGLEPMKVLPSFKGMVMPNLEYNRRLLGGDKSVLQASAHRLNEIMFKEGLLPQLNHLDGLLRADFLSGGEDE